MKEIKAKLIMSLQSCKSDEDVVKHIVKVLSSYTKEEKDKFIHDIVQG